MRLLRKLYQRIVNRWRRKCRWRRVDTGELPELLGGWWVDAADTIDA